MYDSMKNKNLFNMEETIAKDIFEDCDYPWEVLPKIEAFILELGKTLSEDEYDCIDGNIWIAKSATIAPTASITGPSIIGKNTELRQCAYIRGKAIVGENCVVGNSTELKNAILFNNVQVPHFNYIGDSILGFKAHFGAGSIVSNVKSDKSNVSVLINGNKTDTGLRKFGAIVADYVEIGCNAVLNPGTIIGRNSNVYPTSMVRGIIGENMIFKAQGNIVKKI